jgi:hypothetical protein
MTGVREDADSLQVLPAIDNVRRQMKVEMF